MISTGRSLFRTMALAWIVSHSIEIVSAGELVVQINSDQDQPLAGIVVFLETADKQYTKNNNSTIIYQRDKKYQPYVAVMQKGGEITFVNEDRITHHMYALTGPVEFSIKLRAGKISDLIAVNDTGIVPMGCNIHDWMSGYLLVVETPYYGVTDSSGKVRFPDLADKTYQVHAWHPKFSAQENPDTEIKLAGDGKVSISLAYPMAPIPEQKSTSDFDFLEDY